MIAKIITSALVVLVVGMGLAVTSAGGITAGGKQIDPGVALNVEAAGVTVAVSPSQMGADAAERVKGLLLVNNLPDGRIGAYTADYTGLVGYAWQLPLTPELANRALWSRELRTHYAVEIPYQMLQPGDILANVRSGEYGHAVVFERWENQSLWGAVENLTDAEFVSQQLQKGIPFFAFELNSAAMPGQVVERKLTLQEQKGAITVSEMDSTLAGPYYALRYNAIPGYVQLSGKINVLSHVMVGTYGVAQFTLVNRGGTAVKLNHVTAVVYGPDAAQQGLAGTQTMFPEVKEIVLAPGQAYDYNQTFQFDQPGTFLALPRFQVNGVLQMPPQIASFEVVSK